MTIVTVACVVRLGTALIVLATHSMRWLALDALGYIDLATDWARGQTSEWGAYDHQLMNSAGTFLYPLGMLFRAFGSHDLLAQSLSIAFGIMTAATAFVVADRLLSRRWSLGVGMLVAVLPSQVLWSSLALRDPVVWAVTAALALVVSTASRLEGRRLILGGVTVGVLLFLLGHARPVSQLIAAWSLVMAAAFMPGRGRWWRLTGVLAIAGIVTATSSLGAFGVEVIRGHRNFGLTRALNAEGAESAFVDPLSEVLETTAAEFEAKGESRPVPESVAATGLTDDLRHLPQGARAFLIDPVPFDPPAGDHVVLAMMEQLVWYPMLAAAVVGLIVSARGRRWPLAFPAVYLVGISAVYSLTEGNFGTAYRHRGEVVWIVALFAAIGLEWSWRRWRARSAADPRQSAGHEHLADKIGASSRVSA